MSVTSTCGFTCGCGGRVQLCGLQQIGGVFRRRFRASNHHCAQRYPKPSSATTPRTTLSIRQRTPTAQRPAVFIVVVALAAAAVFGFGMRSSGWEPLSHGRDYTYAIVSCNNNYCVCRQIKLGATRLSNADDDLSVRDGGGGRRGIID